MDDKMDAIIRGTCLYAMLLGASIIKLFGAWEWLPWNGLLFFAVAPIALMIVAFILLMVGGTIWIVIAHWWEKR